MGTRVKLSGHLLCLIHQTSAGVLIGVLITIPGLMLSDPKHIYTLTLQHPSLPNNFLLFALFGLVAWGSVYF